MGTKPVHDIRHANFAFLHYSGTSRSLKEALKTLKENFSPDIIHVHSAQPAQYDCVKTNIAPVVVSIWGSDVNQFVDISHSGTPTWKGTRRAWYLQESLPKLAHIIVDDTSMPARCKFLAGERGCAPISILHLGVNTDIYHPLSSSERTAARQAIGIDNNTTLLFSIRAFNRLYRHREILEAFAKAKGTNKAILAFSTFAGREDTPPLGPELTQRVIELGLEEAVIFLKPATTEELPLRIAAADGIINYPAMDGFPVSLAETAAMGVPIITCLHPAYTDTFLERNTVNATHSLTEALTLFLNGTVPSQDHLDAAQKDVLTLYNHNTYCKKLTDIYNKYITKHSIERIQSLSPLPIPATTQSATPAHTKTTTKGYKRIINKKIEYAHDAISQFKRTMYKLTPHHHSETQAHHMSHPTQSPPYITNITDTISVLIPCYNYAHFLQDCLNSLINQTHTNWEAIVVDDCSTTGDSYTIIEALNEKRVHFQKNISNKGLGITLNTAFAASKGDYVIILSADDVLAPQALELLLSSLNSTPCADCSFGDIQLFGNKNTVWRYSIKTERDMTLGQWIPGAGVLMKRSFWEDLGGHSEDRTFSIGNLDWDFWLTATRHGFTTTHIPIPLYLYRIHGVSTSSTRARHDYLTRECMLKKHKSLFEKYGTEKEFISQGYCNALTSCLRAQDWSNARDVWKKARKRDIPTIRLIKTCLRSFKETIRNFPVIRSIWPHLKTAKGVTKHINSLIFSKLYNHPIVQKKYWSKRGHDLYTRYGHSDGGFETLSKVFDKFTPKRILEIGCGNGRNFPLYEKKGAEEIVGQDISKSAIQYAKQRNIPNTRTFECQLNEIPYKSKYFDLTVCNRVLQHIPPKHVVSTIEYAVKFSDIIYINELTNEEIYENNIKTVGPDTFLHNYNALFNSAGAFLEHEYIVKGQRRRIYRVKYN